MFSQYLRSLCYNTALVPCVAVLALGAQTASASELDTDDLLDLSLEELSNIEVTSVSKKAEQADEAAAAIYVITQEDIRRSGATAIPELLRMVPGITVTRSNSHNWTVTARGFNDQFSNKLLVLMDGRTIYSHLFSGVVWQLQDTVLEDIDRIEVIRGPGATLWGANAVNGVINIITKNASETQGGIAVATAGNQIKGIGTVRYGTKIGDDSYVRMYAKQKEYNSEKNPTGITANDDWGKSQFGFRSDSRLSEKDTLNVQGDIYALDEDRHYSIPDLNVAGFSTRVEGSKAVGANLMAKWDRRISDVSDISVQAYFDHAFYKTTYFNDETNTADIEFQQVWTGWQGQEIVWGTGYRFIHSHNDPSSQQYALIPQTNKDHLFSAFIQDKITISPDDVFLTVGSKFEHNSYTGLEIQPSARISWLVDDKQTVWASVSRAVHTPSPSTSSVQQSLSIIAGAPNTLVAVVGNKSLESEELIAYELGYRVKPVEDISLDFAGFYNDYSKLFNGNAGTGFFVGPHALLPIQAQNTNEARSIGGEVSAKWNIAHNWQMAGSYSYINVTFDNNNSVGFSFVGKHPKHQFNARSTYLFSNGLEMTNALYLVDDLTGVNVNGYHRFDTRLSYEVMDGVDLSLVGQNLFDDRHQEFSQFVYTNSAVEIGRSVYASVAIEF